MKFKNYINPLSLYNQLDTARQDFCLNLGYFCDDLPVSSKNKLYNLLLISLPNALLQPSKRYIFEALEKCIDFPNQAVDKQYRYNELKQQWVALWILLKSPVDLSMCNKWSLFDVITANPKYIKTRVTTAPLVEDNNKEEAFNHNDIPTYKKIITKLSNAWSAPIKKMKGSHQSWENENGYKFTIVKPHGNQIMKLWTFKSMLRKARISKGYFQSL